jgi:hypothetical protein
VLHTINCENLKNLGEFIQNQFAFSDDPTRTAPGRKETFGYVDNSVHTFRSRTKAAEFSFLVLVDSILSRTQFRDTAFIIFRTM